MINTRNIIIYHLTVGFEGQDSGINSFSDERLLWINQVKTGIINRKVVEVQRVTTRRVMKNDYSIDLGDIHDIIVTNQRRLSNSQYTGFRPRYSSMSYGSSNSRSKTVGDVIFFHNNGETAFRQIDDPKPLCVSLKQLEKRSWPK